MPAGKYIGAVTAQQLRLARYALTLRAAVGPKVTNTLLQSGDEQRGQAQESKEKAE